MKKIFFLMLTLLIMSVAGMNAQVLIGTGDNPHPSAILELQSNNLGLLFPRVALKSTEDKETIVEPVAGLAVYNTATTGTGATAVVPGIYVFNGTAWTLQAPPVITAQPAAFTFRRLHDVNGDPNGPASVVTISLNVTATGATSYQWYQKPKNFNAPATIIGGATTADYNPAPASWGLYQYYCMVSNPYGSVKSDLAEVAVGCGAKTNTGEWLSFMCQNLGAANVAAGTGTSVDLDGISFEYDGTGGDLDKIDNDAKGWLYQWGRDGKDGDAGYQSRSSQTIAGPAPDEFVSGNQATGSYAGKFITSATLPYDWRTTQYDYAWLTTDNRNPGPCPTGWRVPTSSEWQSICASQSFDISSSKPTSNTWVWKDGSSGQNPDNGNGFKIKPDGYTTTLFLPTAGYRDAAPVGGVGTQGQYYSSSAVADEYRASALCFTNQRVAPSHAYRRNRAMSVRCVAL